MAIEAGSRIAERYQLNHRIAVGGMGEVWEADDERLGRTVAVKVLKSEIGSDPEFLERFRTEARIAASINHRNIAGVHDYGEDATADGPPTAYIVMELVRGEPLSQRLATQGKLGTVLTLDLLEQAARALQAAHVRGFVHRDVKPGNILLSEDGTVKLTDFGIAKAASAAPVTASGMVMGTAHYIAPEQATGSDAGPVGDVYSLGVVGYECLAGHRPFQDESPVKIAMMHINDPVPPLPRDIPVHIRALIATALVKDPTRRYADGAEFAAAVAAVRRGRPPPAPGSPPAGPDTGPRGVVAGPDRAGPSSDGFALVGLSAPGLPPLPGAGRARPPGPARPVTGSQPMGRVRPLPTPAGHGRGGLTAAFVGLTVAAVAIGILVVRQAAQPTPGPIPQTATPNAPAGVSGPAVPGGGSGEADTVQVNRTAYTGRPVAAVDVELRGDGLLTMTRTRDGRPPTTPDRCAVTDVSPAGAVRRGTVVTITCAPG